jgi:arginine-tRNA-protein transferase
VLKRHEIRLYQSAEHACGYWHERVARDLILDPLDPELPRVYGRALAMGFRRSGGHVYRPHCPRCRACIAVRVEAAAFVANRAQRRCLARNADLEIRLAPARRTDENFALYHRYLAARHAGGGMDDPTPEAFDAFLACAWSPTVFVEFRLQGELIALAVTDVVPDALSAVYTYYAPEHANRSLGTLAILTQLARAKHEGRQWLYLGYWLQGHPKMDYKKRFHPLQHFDGERWLDFSLEGL